MSDVVNIRCDFCSGDYDVNLASISGTIYSRVVLYDNKIYSTFVGSNEGGEWFSICKECASSKRQATKKASLLRSLEKL